ncbi:hypothetical protein QZH56_00220 [Streptomyces olivoreticuli]|uniref:hypothetical protein n=1 Tax=Streptomyces olivoreticuli TaxID=68246 RepID=UPI00265A1773|nr:hypothetical protein [Streptomyces olivoreticuli]WKK23358.1 hypothetical protein QZH56_32290 [Streptomyces olivoreticuli]WKK24173.1 hypothetical protein QZH56_00220 [Streptomyces olivoreticuli]
MKRNATIAGAVLAALAALTACGGGADAEESEKPSKTTVAPTTPPAPSSPSTKAPAKAGDVREPDATQTKTLIAALKAIDPGLVVKEDRAVRRAWRVCGDIKAGSTRTNENAKFRFEGGNVPHLSPAQVDALVSAVKTSFCH